MSPSFLKTLLAHQLSFQDYTADEQDPAFLTSMRSHIADIPLKIRDLLEKEKSEKCSDTNNFRFITSMVSHHLPFMDTVAHYDESEMIMTMVAHVFYQIIAKNKTDDQTMLRKEYIEYIEDYVNEDFDEEAQFCFITSFVSHCLPFMDTDTQPIFSELLTSMASHRPGSALNQKQSQEETFSFESRGTVSPIPSPISRYSTDSSSLDIAEIELWARGSAGSLSGNSVLESPSSECPPKVASDSSPEMGPLFLTDIDRKRDSFPDKRRKQLELEKQSLSPSDSTPESLKSLEPLPMHHLLSNYSEKQLDIDFCAPSECSVSTNGYDNSPGDSLSPLSDIRFSSSGSPPSENGYFGSKEQSASPTYRVEVSESEASDTWLVEDRDITITEMEDNEVLEFEARELSDVPEEDEDYETEDTDTLYIEQVVTATCTIGVDTPIKIETVVETTHIKDKKEAKDKQSDDPDVKTNKTASEAVPDFLDKKHVTFVNEEPIIINADSDSQSPEEEKIEEVTNQNVPDSHEKDPKPSTSQTAKDTSPHKESKKKPQYRVRFQMQVGSDTPKVEKKSLFDVVLGWFGKYI